MPTLYVYDLASFTTPPPNEKGAQAEGSPNFVISTAGTLNVQAVEVTDNDTMFDEIDAPQTLTNNVTLNGDNYSAGDRIFGNYILSNSTGIKFISITMGVNNSGKNVTHGIVSTMPLTPNTTYTFTSEQNFNGNSIPYDDSAVCFTAGTLIRTAHGNRPIEDLKPGDLIVTEDDGLQPIRWIGGRKMSPVRLMLFPHLQPILIRKDTFGPGIPFCDMHVSPQHRMLLRSHRAALYTGCTEPLAAAKSLVNGSSIQVDDQKTDVTYIHMMFDRHQLVHANGTLAESFFPGDQAIESITDASRAELFDIFPELRDETTGFGPLIRPSLKPAEAQLVMNG